MDKRSWILIFSIFWLCSGCSIQTGPHLTKEGEQALHSYLSELEVEAAEFFPQGYTWSDDELLLLITNSGIVQFDEHGQLFNPEKADTLAAVIFLGLENKHQFNDLTLLFQKTDSGQVTNSDYVQYELGSFRSTYEE